MTAFLLFCQASGIFEVDLYICVIRFPGLPFLTHWYVINIFMHGFMKTVLENLRPNQVFFQSKGDDKKIWKEIQSFFTRWSSFYSGPFPIFSFLHGTWNMKSKCNMDDLAQISDTVFINPVIFKNGRNKTRIRTKRNKTPTTDYTSLKMLHTLQN